MTGPQFMAEGVKHFLGEVVSRCGGVLRPHSGWFLNHPQASTRATSLRETMM